MELKSHEWRDDVFAATPPLEAQKMSDDVIVVTLDDDTVVALLDLSRAHFRNPSRRRVFVDLCAGHVRIIPEGHVRHERCSEQLGSFLHGGACQEWSRRWQIITVPVLAQG
ncbi:unnamed protein product [Polarella glacialis]|uniref:Uncharacterized protein n=1 Tax=Polarella glacialis TaxID=89957 RepID=A0A813KKZ0_POLGL|nr:unnamed protein product [Polarella glacialis]